MLEGVLFAVDDLVGALVPVPASVPVGVVVGVDDDDGGAEVKVVDVGA